MEQYNQYCTGTYLPDISLVASADLLNLNFGAIRIKAAYDSSINFDGNPEGNSSFQLDINSVNRTVESVGIRSNLDLGRYGLEIYSGLGVDGIIPSVSGGIHVTKPWVNSALLNSYNEFTGEFSGDVNNDGTFTFRSGSGVESGAASNGVSIEVSVDESKYGEFGAKVIAVGISSYIAYSIYRMYQGDLKPATAGAAAVAIFGMYDTIKKAIAASNLT